MLNSTDSIQDVVKLLRETRDPGEKAALIAELVLSELPDVIALTARKCVILHWFDQFTITALLQNDHLTSDEIRNVYEQIISLPFIEKLPWGFAIQNLTREGLLKRYISTQPTLLKSAAHLAARGYEVSDNETIAAEALFCYVIAGDQVASEKLLDRLTERALERGDTHYTENLQGLLKEAVLFPFVDSLINRSGARLIDLNNLANLYLDQGKYEQAEPLYVRTLAIREQQLGPTHPDTAASLNNLANLYLDQGKYEQVEPLYMRALAIREQQLGETHPNTASSLNNLAALYQAQGKYKQAEPLSQRALAIREQQLGPDHPDTATSLNNLATLYRAQGKYEQAEPLSQRALAIREQQLGPDHPNTAQSLNNLGQLYYYQGKYEQAEPLYLRALAIREQQLGPQHPDTALSLWWLATLSEQQQRYQQAASLYQRAIPIYEHALGLQHPDTQHIRADYAHLLRTMGHDAKRGQRKRFLGLFGR